jgi:HD superfamily phosphohydrolase
LNQKAKILNDPVYGFITIPSGLIFEIIASPCFQRLRRIRQLGLTFMVYPGANHTRLQHALGAMHLMGQAIDIIRSKGHEITEKEAESAKIAILLHDIGHGPFSHTLEYNIIDGITHEGISLLFMKRLNKKFNGALDLAINIFTNKYHKKYLHQLVSGQLDTDRLDYLNRDSFFTGVSEGVIGSDRIIKMLDVIDNELVVEEKGIYSIEKFLIARRLMYWQVYLHKTVLASEQLLINIMSRAKEIVREGNNLFAPEYLLFFLKNDINTKNSSKKEIEEILNNFTLLDDSDILSSIKSWTNSDDKILSNLSRMLIYRDLFKVEMQKVAFSKKYIALKTNSIKEKYSINKNEIKYFLVSGKLLNNTYSYNNENIKIKLKSGEIVDIVDASDILNMSALSKKDKKYYLCYPKF